MENTIIEKEIMNLKIPYDAWKNSYDFKPNGNNISLKGYSIAGKSTGFFIPQLKFMFDAGIGSLFNPKHIFITHLHSDHTQALPQLLTGISTKPNVFIPKNMSKYIIDYLLSFEKMTNCDETLTDEIFKDRFTLIEVENGNEIIINSGKTYCINIFNTCHCLPSVGYAVFEIKKTIKPEYKNLSKEEKNKMIDDNIDIFITTKIPLLVYTGDTTTECYNNEIFNMYKFPLIITECSFIKELNKKDLSHLMHTSIEDIEPFIKSHPETQFVLVHWSERYSKEQIYNNIESKSFINVKIWL